MHQSDTAPALDPDHLRAYLERHHAAGVVVRETHISWVFLVGERAYKLKKQMVLPFLDYGTAARRRQMCLKEVRLNRRLAPGIYLGVRAVVPVHPGVELSDETDPRAVDYVVEMRRYEEDRTLAATLQRGELSIWTSSRWRVHWLTSTHAATVSTARATGPTASSGSWIAMSRSCSQ